MEPLREETFASTRGWLRGQTVRFSDSPSAAARTQPECTSRSGRCWCNASPGAPRACRASSAPPSHFARRRVPNYPDYGDALKWSMGAQAGARTAWHSHARGQTLHVTQGTAWDQSRGGEKVVAHPGQTL